MDAVEITCFSDVLCIWAYVSQARIDAVREKFRDAVRLRHRFCSVFGNTAEKIDATWNDKGGYQGFNAHLREVAERFPHVDVHPRIWLETRPATSASAHLFMKAVEQWDQASGAIGSRSAPSISDRVMWAFRCAFFRDCLDIARWDIQCGIAEPIGVDIGAIEDCIHRGVAFARLTADYQDADRMRIEGSPSYVLNEGRQRLYGNIGFRVMEANVQELLRAPGIDDASWC